jgi:hypothetical protein
LKVYFLNEVAQQILLLAAGLNFAKSNLFFEIIFCTFVASLPKKYTTRGKALD